MHGNAQSNSFTYTVPTGGSNKALIVFLGGIDPSTNLTVTQNGVSVPLTLLYTSATAYQSYMRFGTLAAPTTGIFSMNGDLGLQHYTAVLFTVQNAAQTGTIDATSSSNFSATTSNALSITTHTGSTLLVSASDWGNDSNALTNSGAGETDILSNANGGGATAPGNTGSPPSLIMGKKNAASVAGAESMTTSATISATGDHGMIAIKSSGGGSGGAGKQDHAV
jgi:hypothetical protein